MYLHSNRSVNAKMYSSRQNDVVLLVLGKQEQGRVIPLFFVVLVYRRANKIQIIFIKTHIVQC